MALTKVSRNLLSTGIDDQSNATAITIDSGEKITIANDLESTWAASADRFIGMKYSTTYALGMNLLESGREVRINAKAADTGGKITFGTGTSYNERMIIDGSGNVGIGTSSPSQLLHLGGATNKGIQITTATSNAGYLAVYQDQSIFGVNRDPSDGSFADTGKTAQFISLQSANGDGWIKFATTSTNNIEPTERVRITGAGNVGIGTSSPSVELHVYSANQDALKIQTNTAVNQIELANSTTSPTYITQDSYSLVFKADDNAWGGTASSIQFRVKNSEAARINSSKRIGIGETSYVGALTIRGEVGQSFHAIDFTHNTSTVVGNIVTSASSTAYNTSSDYRLKENVVEMDSAIDRVKLLQPKRFNFIADADKTVDGFIAHEVQDIVPEAIHGVKDEVDEEGNPVYQGIDQSKLVPLLTKAIQEQQVLIEQLQAEVALLKGE